MTGMVGAVETYPPPRPSQMRMIGTLCMQGAVLGTGDEW